jgi:phosphatidylglycerophosphate synthase
VRTVRTTPLILGILAEVALLAALAATVGLSAAGWVLGVAYAVVLNGLLAYGLAGTGDGRLGPADLVTLTRATLVGGVLALVPRDGHSTLLVALVVVALAGDFLDGWLARRTGTATDLGAQFDGEVDAFLILVLCVPVARTQGDWVLIIGAARYAFLVAGAPLPWMRGSLPPRYWRKVVAAIQGIVLAAALIPNRWTGLTLVLALGLLTESFGRDVLWLWTHRMVNRTPVGSRVLNRHASTRSR